MSSIFDVVRSVVNLLESSCKRRVPVKCMRFLIAGYRDWAIDSFVSIRDNLQSKGHYFAFVNDHQELTRRLMEDERYDAVFLIGWSWIIPHKLCESNNIVGVHPSNLPDYAGGSPIQHQILAGLTKTVMSFGRVNPGIDDWTIYDREPISLEGTIYDIFVELTRSTIVLFQRYVDGLESEFDYELAFKKSNARSEQKVLKRLKPEQSELTRDLLSKLTARQIYDFIRCRTGPYPHAFISDETGVVKFPDVTFESKERDNVNWNGLASMMGCQVDDVKDLRLKSVPGGIRQPIVETTGDFGEKLRAAVKARFGE